MNYDVLLFDADNTLFDFTACEKAAFEKTLRAFGVDEKPGMLETYSAYNDACWKELERGEIEKPALVVKRFALFLGHYGIKGDPAEFNRAYLDNLSREAVLFEGAEEMIARLSEKARVYIITNGVTSVQRGRFARTGLPRCVKDVFISEQMGTKKPDALFFEKVAKAIPGFRKERALVVGDSLTSDILGANNAGLDCLWFNPKGEKAPEGLRITAEARDLRQMESIINGETL